MAYPTLPPMHYLHPIPNMPNQHPHQHPHQHYQQQQPRSAHSSASASSVEPITPDLQHNNSILAGENTQNGEDTIECKWKGCSFVAPTPDNLYDHLCNMHVGRKSTNNLNLTCGWEGCGVKCVKRDHITSHLRGESSRSFTNMSDLWCQIRLISVRLG